MRYFWHKTIKIKILKNKRWSTPVDARGPSTCQYPKSRVFHQVRIYRFAKNVSAKFNFKNNLPSLKFSVKNLQIQFCECQKKYYPSKEGFLMKIFLIN